MTRMTVTGKTRMMVTTMTVMGKTRMMVTLRVRCAGVIHQP